MRVIYFVSSRGPPRNGSSNPQEEAIEAGERELHEKLDALAECLDRLEAAQRR